MFGSIAVLFFLPWLDTSKVRSAVYRPLVQAVLLAVRGQCARSSAGSARARPKASTSSWRRSARSTTSASSSIIMPLLGLFETPRRCRTRSPRRCWRRTRRAAQAIAGAAAAPDQRLSDRKLERTLPMRTSGGRAAGGARLGRGTGAAAERRRTPDPSRARKTGPLPARSAPTTRPSCSAASRSTRKSARPAIR